MVDKNICFLAVYHGDNEFTIVSTGQNPTVDWVAFLQFLKASFLNSGPDPSGFLGGCFFNYPDLKRFLMTL